jgi:hypothetical protein
MPYLVMAIPVAEMSTAPGKKRATYFILSFSGGGCT